MAITPFLGNASEEAARTHFFHALKSKQEGNLIAAEGLLRKAIGMEPENPDFHFELGNLYIEQGNLENARMEFEQAVMIRPAHLASHYNLGLVYRDLGLGSEARSQFRRVLELDPKNVKAELQIGYTDWEEGFLEDAREAFERAREINPTDPEPGRALDDLDQFEAEIRERKRREAEEALYRQRMTS